MHSAGFASDCGSISACYLEANDFQSIRLNISFLYFLMAVGPPSTTTMLGKSDAVF
jgi:hypothetical protein